MKKIKKSIILIILCIIGVVSGVWRASEKIKLSELPVVYPPKPIEVVKLYQPTDLSLLNEDKPDNEVEMVDNNNPNPVDGLEYDVVKHIYALAEEHGYDPALLLSLAKHESDFNITLYSSTNDAGLFQINKCNWNRLSKHFGCTVDEIMYDPYWNSRGGVFLLNEARNSYPNENEHIWLMVYNLGLGGAQKAFQQGIYSTRYSREIIEGMSEF